MRRKDVDELVNACDAGREGELIFKLILQTAKVQKPVRRAWFSSMTKTAIRDAFEHLRDDSELRPLEDAARARSESDWLIGMNATRAATTRIGTPRSPVSLGRVQTPTLALIVRRDLEISAFVPEDYWQVQAQFDTAASERYTGMWQQGSSNRLKSAEEAERIADAAERRRTRSSSRSSASRSSSSRRSCTTSRPCSARRTSASASPPSARWPRPRAATSATRC